jgi:hypothetical protein
MSTWLRNERVEFCLAVIIGVVTGSSPVVIIPILENLVPGRSVVVASLMFLACTGVAMIVWWLTRHPE